MDNAEGPRPPLEPGRWMPGSRPPLRQPLVRHCGQQPPREAHVPTGPSSPTTPRPGCALGVRPRPCPWDQRSRTEGRTFWDSVYPRLARSGFPSFLGGRYGIFPLIFKTLKQSRKTKGGRRDGEEFRQLLLMAAQLQTGRLHFPVWTWPLVRGNQDPSNNNSPTHPHASAPSGPWLPVQGRAWLWEAVSGCSEGRLGQGRDCSGTPVGPRHAAGLGQGRGKGELSATVQPQPLPAGWPWAQHP